MRKNKKNNKSYRVKLTIEFPFECRVEAKNEDEATDIATDNAIDYLEHHTSYSRRFDEFWEYVIEPKLVSIEEDEGQ